MRGSYLFTRIYTPIVFSCIFAWSLFALWTVIHGKKKADIRWVPVLLLVDTAIVAFGTFSLLKEADS